jgi:hypothetical protein
VRILVIGLLTVALTVRLLAEPSDTDKPPNLFDKRSCSGQALCLPGPNQKAIYFAMAQAIGTFEGVDWGFPAEIIAAAYGWESLGIRVSRPLLPPQLLPYPQYPPSGTVKREVTSSALRAFLKQLSQAKRRVSTQATPVIVSVDIPTLGPRLYDANLIRDLVSTELVPHRIRIRSYKIDNVLVPYVILQSGPAELAQGCFKEAAADGGLGCPNKLGQPEQKQAPLRQVPFGLGFVSGEGGKPDLQAPAMSEPGDLKGLLAELPNRDKAAVPIRVSREGVCTPFDKISPEDKKQWNLPAMAAGTRACLNTFILRLPPMATNSYRTIAVEAEIKPEESYVYCGPSQLKAGTITPIITPICPLTSFARWDFSATILRQPLVTTQSLLLLVRPPTSADSTLRLVLSGTAFLEGEEKSPGPVETIP